jgi:hypothetical protein
MAISVCGCFEITKKAWPMIIIIFEIVVTTLIFSQCASGSLLIVCAEWFNTKLYGIKSIPQNLLINPEEVIVASTLRGSESNKRLMDLPR